MTSAKREEDKTRPITRQVNTINENSRQPQEKTVQQKIRQDMTRESQDQARQPQDKKDKNDKIGQSKTTIR